MIFYDTCRFRLHTSTFGMKIRLMHLFFRWVLLKKSANKFFNRPKTINFVLACRDDHFCLLYNYLITV